MKSNLFVGFICIILWMFPYSMQGQFSPYSLSPKWHFGNRSGLDFTSGAPVFLSGGQTNTLLTRMEGSSVICDPNRDIVFYSDNYNLYDAGHNLISSPLRGGTSSTQGSVIVPDPADPSNRFYLFTANVDPGGGGDQPAVRGVHYYHIEKSVGSVSIIGGPTQIAADNETTEMICAGTDGNGNYWVLTHQGGNFPPGWGLNKIYAWPVTSSGVGARVESSLGGVGNNYWHGSMKINKCQNKLAIVYATGFIEVYNWDKATGTVVGPDMIKNVSGLPSLYGCEFSPDGNVLYYTSLSGNQLYQLDLTTGGITTGNIYTDASWVSQNDIPEMGSLQLGPDDKIYVVNVSNWDAGAVYLGVVNNPNVVGAGCNYDNQGFLIKNDPAFYPNVARGIANVAWMSPNLPQIQHTVLNCTEVRFDFDFNTYFNDSVWVKPDSIEWDFGDGNGFNYLPSYPPPRIDFGSQGTFNVQLRFIDSICGQTWTAQKTIDVNCSLPVTWLSLDAQRIDQGVKLSWATSQEIGNGHFVIERSSDGEKFETVGTTAGNMTIFAISEYSFTDPNPLAGPSYYRIRQVDEKGTFSFSKKVFVEEKPFIIQVYPNPSNNEFTLSASGNQEGKLSVTDVLGREVFASDFTSEITFGDFFSPGTYVVKIVYNEEIRIQKVVKR